MSRSPVVAALCASLLLQGCTHAGSYRQGGASAFAMEDDPAGESSAESAAAPSAPPSCSIAPSVVGGMAKALLAPLLLCLAGGPICGIVVEEAAGVAVGIIAGSMVIGGLVGAIGGGLECSGRQSAPSLPAPLPEPELQVVPAPEPPAAKPPPSSKPATEPSPLEPCPIGPVEPAPAP